MRTLALLSVGLLVVSSCGPVPEQDEDEIEQPFVGGKADLPAADQSISAVKQWASTRVKQAETAFRAAGYTYQASPTNWADQIIYQIQVDRFADGDPSNNGKNVSSWQQAHRFTDQDGLADYHHGGDLQGIINRLDYLKDLRVTTLWITPVLMGNGSYHGYCTTDFSQIDPQFGTAALLRTLTTEAHKRGLRVVLDVVVNHMCSNDSHYDSTTTPFKDWAYSECVNDQNAKRWSGGGAIRGQRDLIFGSSFFRPLRHKSFFSRCGNKAGDYATQGAGAMFGDFSDRMLDLDTMNWDLQDIFTDLHKYWIAYADIDGFRVDAAKHVTEDFLAKFSTEVRAYAAGLGKKNFFLVGEVAASTYEQALRVAKMRSNWVYPSDTSAQIPQTLRNRLGNLKATYLNNAWFPYPGLNAVYDFGGSGTAVDVFHGARAPIDIKSWFWAGGEQDNTTCGAAFCELATNSFPALNWNILEIHDWPRFAQNGTRWQLEAALAYLMTSLGAPVLYYGVEQGLSGNCNWSKMNVTGTALQQVKSICSSYQDSRYRQDMFLEGPWRLGSAVPEIDQLARIGFDSAKTPQSWWTDPYLNRAHGQYQLVRKLNAVRQSCKALRRGQIYFRAAHSSAGAGLLAFSRIVDGNNEVVVLINIGDGWISPTTLYVDGGNAAFTIYKNLLNGNDRASVGQLGTGKGLYFLNGFTLGPHGMAIFAPESNTKTWDSVLGAHLCWN
jgi:glycosidase